MVNINLEMIIGLFTRIFFAFFKMVPYIHELGIAQKY